MAVCLPVGPRHRPSRSQSVRVMGSLFPWCHLGALPRVYYSLVLALKLKRFPKVGEWLLVPLLVLGLDLIQELLDPQFLFEGVVIVEGQFGDSSEVVQTLAKGTACIIRG